jgi:predicted anti-sigma-YlaC factor YlaD
MSCSSFDIFDIKEYFAGEATGHDRGRVEKHLAECHECREELARLQLTQASLLAVREEEIPRRIAFVSDKVFEPRWRQRFWNSGPKLAFVAASLVACAIIVHAFVRPPERARVAPSPSLDAAAIEARIQRETAARVDEAVAKAVAASEARQQRKTAELLSAMERRFEHERRIELATYSGQLALLEKQINRDFMLANNLRMVE